MMKLSCPACRKPYDDAPGSCVRCGCDMSVLVTIVRAAEHELYCSKKKLQVMEYRHALHHAEKSWRLKRTTASARLAFLACLAEKRFIEASRWYAYAQADLEVFQHR